MPQARRLLNELGSLLKAPTRLLLLALLALATGCSTKIEVETTDAARPGAVTSTRTAVGLDLLTDNKSEPAPEKTKAAEIESPVDQESAAAPGPASGGVGEGEAAGGSVFVGGNVVTQ